MVITAFFFASPAPTTSPKDRIVPTLTRNPSFLPSDLSLMSRETDMFLTTVTSLAPQELSAPSRREGWTRADVLAQVIRTAEAITDLMTRAHTGEADGATSRPADASGSADTGDTADTGDVTSDPAQVTARTRQACERLVAAAENLRSGIAAPSVSYEGQDIDARWLPGLWTTHVIVDHHDLDTVWELEEADITALEDAMELLAFRLDAAQAPDAPGLRLRTAEGEEHVIGGADGAPVVTLRAERAALVAWITRGSTQGVEALDGDLPPAPAPVLLEPR